MPLSRHYCVHLPTSIAKAKGSGLLTHERVYILGNRRPADWPERDGGGTRVDCEQAHEDRDQQH